MFANNYFLYLTLLDNCCWLHTRSLRPSLSNNSRIWSQESCQSWFGTLLRGLPKYQKQIWSWMFELPRQIQADGRLLKILLWRKENSLPNNFRRWKSWGFKLPKRTHVWWMGSPKYLLFGLLWHHNHQKGKLIA